MLSLLRQRFSWQERAFLANIMSDTSLNRKHVSFC